MKIFLHLSCIMLALKILLETIAKYLILTCWQGRVGRHRSGEIWKAIHRCLMWCLWQERNARLFEGCKRNILDPNYSSSALCLIGY